MQGTITTKSSSSPAAANLQVRRQHLVKFEPSDSQLGRGPERRLGKVKLNG